MRVIFSDCQSWFGETEIFLKLSLDIHEVYSAQYLNQLQGYELQIFFYEKYDFFSLEFYKVFC